MTADIGLSIGFIGLGGVANAHLEAYKLLLGLQIKSVCDVRPDIGKKIADEWGAAFYEDYKDLLAAGDIDLVLVLTPASTHREIVEAAADAGVHALCEKPLAVTWEDGQAMVDACAQAGVKFFYGSCYRYLPAVMAAKRLIDDGVIGDVQLMTEQLIGGNGADAYQQLSPIHYPTGGPGGPGMGLVDHGVHLIDIFSWFCSSPVAKAYGQGQISGAPAVSEYMAMHFENGAVGHLVYNAATYGLQLPGEGMFSGGRGWLTDGSLSDTGAWESEPGSIYVYGTKGALRVFHYTNAVFLRDANGFREVSVEGRPAFGHFATQLEACAKAIHENSAPPISGEDGLRALKAMLAVYES
ncbi:MAG: Gfo/Idh/MocA family oxidoreductase [Pseudomonadota bacterium]